MTDFTRVHRNCLKDGSYVPFDKVHRADLIDRSKYAIPVDALVANYADGDGWYLLVHVPGSSAFTVWERQHPPVCHDPAFVPMHEVRQLSPKNGPQRKTR